MELGDLSTCLWCNKPIIYDVKNREEVADLNPDTRSMLMNIPQWWHLETRHAACERRYATPNA